MVNQQGTNKQSSSYQQKTTQVVRTFSDEIKRKKVKEFDMGLCTVRELSRELSVSRSAIYKWIKKYSVSYQKPIRVVVESKSYNKQVKHLKEELSVSYQKLGEKQIELEFYKELISIVSDHMGEDVLKKFSPNLTKNMGKKRGEKNKSKGSI